MTSPVIIGSATRIYALCEFPDQTPRYVGKTVQPLRLRLIEHLRTARRAARLPVHRWLAKRERESRLVCIKWLETVDAEGDWQAAERMWIAKLRAEGERLLNLTDGGEGLAGHIFSQTHRERIGAALKTGAEFACEQCGANFWRKRRDIQQGNCRFCSRPCYAKSLKGVSRPVLPACTERGIAAAATEKRNRTHCKRGHVLSGTNLFRTSAGSRGCKECRKIHKRTYLERARG